MKTRSDKGKIRKDLSGKVFGKLTVIEFFGWIEAKHNRCSYWLCRCECNNLCKIRGASLSFGMTKSCGCYKPNKMNYGESALNRLIDNYKRHAKDRNYIWMLSKDEVILITKQNCLYCGSEPKSEYKANRCNGVYIYNGIDRINNKEGYCINNVVACCSKCNFMKKDMSIDEFKNHIFKISKNLFHD